APRSAPNARNSARSGSPPPASPPPTRTPSPSSPHTSPRQANQEMPDHRIGPASLHVAQIAARPAPTHGQAASTSRAAGRVGAVGGAELAATSVGPVTSNNKAISST